MSLIKDALTNPLTLLPPEWAHNIGLLALQAGLGPRAKTDDPTLATPFLGKTLRNPVGLSAGAEKNATALKGWTRMGFGLVEAGTVTLNPRPGNPAPRIWRKRSQRAVINWMGLPGRGIGPFVENLKHFQDTPERARLILGASIAAPDGVEHEFTELAKACAPFVDYIALNGSCPNVAHGDGGDALQALTAQIKATITGAGDVPVLLKLGPTRDMGGLKQTIEAALPAGVRGFIATNTVPFDKRNLLNTQPAGDWPTHDGAPVGGYSGPALLDISCAMIAEIRKIVGPDMPLIGVGGIQSAQDARRILDAGANALQLYTGLIYQGPKLVQDIKAALTEN